MTDLSTTIAPKSDQLNADDLIAGPITIKITKVSANPSSPEQPISINFEGDGGKPYLPCKSMRRVLVQVWGRDGNTYPGRSMTLYRDPKVLFGGLAVGGIRISHMTHIDEPVTMALTATKAQRRPFTVQPLVQEKSKHKTWAQLLEELGERFAAAQTREAVDALLAIEDVQKARDSARNGTKDKIEAIISAALTRTAPAPSDAPSDDVAAFVGRVSRMSLAELNRLDGNEAHKTWLRSLTPEDYREVAATLEARLAELRGGA